MKRPALLLVLLLLSGGLAAREDDFPTFRDSLRAAFGLMAGSVEPTADDRLAAVEGVATYAHERSTELLISIIHLQKNRIDDLIEQREAIRTGRDKSMRGRMPENYLRALKKKIDGELKVLEKIEQGLARVTDKDARALLASMGLRSKHWKTREVVARVIGTIGDRTYIKPLVKALKDRDARVRTSIVLALGAMRAEEAYADIVKALKDKDWMVRSATIDTLGKLLDPRAVEALVDRMEEEETRLASDCADALEKITGQTFGRSPDIWRKWWAENREKVMEGEKAPPVTVEEEEEEKEKDRYYHGIAVKSAHTVFILDVSESMSYSTTEFTKKPKEGEISRLELAKIELGRAIDRYDPKGSFGLIAFHTVVKVWRPRLVPAKKRQMKDDALAWVEKLPAEGTTNIYGALEAAFRMAGMGIGDKYYQPLADTIFLLSDGAPTNEDRTIDDPERVLRAVREWNRLGRMRIHTVGLKGHSEKFMKALATQNGGTYSAVD